MTAAFARPGCIDGKRSLSLKSLDHGLSRTGAGEGGEQTPDGVVDLMSGSSTTSPAGYETKPMGSIIGSSPRRALDSCRREAG